MQFFDQFSEGLADNFGILLGMVLRGKIQEMWIGREVGREGEESEADWPRRDGVEQGMGGPASAPSPLGQGGGVRPASKGKST